MFEPSIAPASVHTRPRIAKRIRDLLLLEMGEDIDVALLLGPPEYARAVLSLCRGCGNAELVALSEEFAEVTLAEVARAREQGWVASAHG